MLTNKWLNSTVYYDADKEGNGGGKSAAEIQRESIKINSTTTGDKKVETLEPEEPETEEPEEPEVEEPEIDELIEEPSEEDTKKELEKLRKQVERLNKRVGKTIGERDNIKKELREAKASLDAKLKDGTQPLTEDEVERRATEKANQTVIDREFNRDQERLAKAAIKADKDFMKKVNELAEDVAPIPGQMIGMLTDLENENGGAVLAYLANNPDEFEEIHTLSMVKMARRLDKISEKLAEEVKPKPKKISSAPKPLEGVGGNASNNSTLVITGKESMEDFARKRAIQIEQRRKDRMR